MKFFIVFLILITISIGYTSNENKINSGVPAMSTECPKGLINDTAPGQCGMYKDEDSNEICDLSE